VADVRGGSSSEKRDCSNCGREEPIQRLTHKNAEFKWGEEQQVAFEKLKELITHADALAYFNVNSRTRIVADASPVGLGAVLTQLHGSEWRVIG